MKAVLVVLRFFVTPREIKTLLLILAFLLIIPALGIVAVAQAPLAVVSAALAALNPVTHLVEVKDANGTVVAQLSLSTVWPVWGQVTTEFGESTPYQASHTGTDIAGGRGDPITPFMAGKVTTADASGKSGYGKYVIVNHGNNVTSLYGHLDDVNVKVGQEVKPGGVIGLEGATGHVVPAGEGVHLHFEIRVYDVPVNPRTFMVGNPLPRLGR